MHQPCLKCDQPSITPTCLECMINKCMIETCKNPKMKQESNLVYCEECYEKQLGKYLPSENKSYSIPDYWDKTKCIRCNNKRYGSSNFCQPCLNTPFMNRLFKGQQHYDLRI